MIKIYNTLSKSIEEFVPSDPNQVKMYSCGPTVYDFAHIGNLRNYIFNDILRRTLIHAGFGLKQVMNLTDVDDKTIKGSQKMGNSLVEYTTYYANEFILDMKSLNLETPDIVTKATDNIEEMIKLVNILLEKEIAYKSEDGIYFDIARFPNYGKLSGQKLEDLRHGARVAADTYDKETAGDFVLWKFWTKDDGEVFWEADFGKGRPGWHLECSAMIHKLLGEPIDIHTGAEDLIFPHHENEIAQSESAYDETLSKYFVHLRHLMVDGKKMSKSLGNFYTLRDLCSPSPLEGEGSVKGNYDPMAFKLLCLQAHYRTPLNFTLKELDATQNTLNSLKSLMWSLNKISNEGDSNDNLEEKRIQSSEAFWAFIEDDLKTPQALAEMFGYINEINKNLANLTTSDVESILSTFADFDQVLGIFTSLELPENSEIPEEIKTLTQTREQARKEGNFDKSDLIRAELKEFGWEIEDTKFGQKLTKK